MFSVCSPAIIYVIFSLTQVIIDMVKGLYNTALVKVVVMVMVTLLLNILCERGLGVISWLIVFIPFILMTVIVTLLLYFFGLNATTGTINYNATPLYYNQQPINNNNMTNNMTNNMGNNMGNNILIPPNGWSSSPAYQQF